MPDTLLCQWSHFPGGSGSSTWPNKAEAGLFVNECNDLNNLSSCEQRRWKTRAEGRRQERVQLTMAVLIINHS